MNKIDKYLENLVLPGGAIVGPSGILEINPETKGKIIESVYEVSFNSLYANLLVKLYEEDIFENNGIDIDKKIISEVKRFFTLKKSSLRTDEQLDYTHTKAWVNSLYSNELRMFTPMIFELYRQYMRKFWNDFIQANKFNWLYVDTDTAFISGKLYTEPGFIRSIGIDFNITHHELFYLESPKKYVITDNNNIKIKGHRFQPDEIIGIMKSKLRNKKIDILLS
jgi:hypothetical protein